MKEINYHTLRTALNQLPVHEPASGDWEKMEQALAADEAMSAALQQLPEYEPEVQIWENIEAHLDRDKTEKSWTVIYRKQIIAAAASAVLLLAATLFFNPFNRPSEQISVREEKIDRTLLNALQEPENPAIDLVKTICQEQKNVCQQPEFQLLKTELDELTAAKSELKMALGNFGNDPELINEMVKIERERSKILEQMVNMI
jgi:hypothetical protein